MTFLSRQRARVRWRGESLLAIALAILFVLVAPAGAHSNLITTSPTPGQTVGGTLESIDLVFDAGVEDVEVTFEAPDGEFLDVGIEQPSTNWLQLVIDTPELDGQYIVRYSFISEDGDPVESAYAFSYEASAPEAVAVPRSTVSAELTTNDGFNPFATITGVLALGVLVLLILLAVRLRELHQARTVADGPP